MFHRRALRSVNAPFAVAAWTPASLSGLVAWYDASVNSSILNNSNATASNGEGVKTWQDQSGHGYHITQATSGSRPTYQSAGFNSSHPTVSFGGHASPNWLSTATDAIANISIGGSAKHASWYLVANFTFGGGLSEANSRALSYMETGITNDFGSAGSGFFGNAGTAAALISFRAGFLGSGDAITDNANKRIGVIFDGSNATIYINNSAGTPIACTSTFTVPGTLNVGSDTIGGSVDAAIFGAISEIVLTSNALGSSDRTSLDDYFKAKWGL